MNKKTYNILMIIGTILTVAVYGVTIMINEYKCHIYTRKAFAIGTHTLITNDGNMWEVEDDLNIRTYYNVKFYDNKTIDITDDIIKAVEFREF